MPYSLYELFILSTILLSFGAIVAYCSYIKSQQKQFAYEQQYVFFQNIPQISLKPQSLLDKLAYIGLLFIIIFLLWNNFYDIGIKHFDSVLYIDNFACNLKTIYIHNFLGRFTIFSQQDWGLLAPIMYLLDCNYYFPFTWVSVQFLLTVYLLVKIIPFQNIFYKIIATCLIIGNASFLIPFTNLIIPERNALFLITLFLYCYIRFYQTQKIRYMLWAICSANVALYFKEPIFLFLGGFAGTMLLINILSDKKNLKTIITNPLNLTKKYPMEFLLLSICTLFILLYALNSESLMPDANGYAGGSFQTSYMAFIIKRLFIYPYPLFWLSLAMPIIYLIDYKNYQKNAFSIALFVGGLLYLILITLFRFDSLYYYAAPTTIIILALCFYLKNLSLPTQLHRKFVASGLIAFILFSTPFIAKNLVNATIHEKIIQYQLSAFKENLPFKQNESIKIFNYTRYKGTSITYAMGIAFSILSNLSADPAFHLYGFGACYGSSDRKECSKADHFNPNDYDAIVFWRDHISDAEWQKLYAQYGARMEKITHFPRYITLLNQDKGFHLYMINNL
ncbi:MAG: hypothetical protein K0U39_04010 [Alphaproteobacteria bacterium]|nr:hypothetical protein [Alphaproteobacteria bacterium]